jgi:predicted nuclease of predicted toxin-antitoxin system
LKFLVDMPLPPGLATHLRNSGHEAVHAGEIGMHRSLDAEILATATRDGRIVVTADLDFPRLSMLAEYATASVILFRGGDFDDATAFEFMRRALVQLDAMSSRRFIMTVDRHRIRRRWLS